MENFVVAGLNHFELDCNRCVRIKGLPELKLNRLALACSHLWLF